MENNGIVIKALLAAAMGSSSSGNNSGMTTNEKQRLSNTNTPASNTGIIMPHQDQQATSLQSIRSSLQNTSTLLNSINGISSNGVVEASLRAAAAGLTTPVTHGGNLVTAAGAGGLVLNSSSLNRPGGTTVGLPSQSTSTVASPGASALQEIMIREEEIRGRQQSLMAHHLAIVQAKQKEEQRLLDQRHLDELRMILTTTQEQKQQQQQQQQQLLGLASQSPTAGLLAIAYIQELANKQNEQQLEAHGNPSNLPWIPRPSTQQMLLARSLTDNNNTNTASQTDEKKKTSSRSCTSSSKSSSSTTVSSSSFALPNALPQNTMVVIKRDTNDDNTTTNNNKSPKRPGRPRDFPNKLFQMLTDMDNNEIDNNIVSFLPHGRAFMIYDTEKFAKHIMPKYFGMSHYTSFQRQLNHYEIRRVIEGPDKNAYFHELLVRGRPDLCSKIQRSKIIHPSNNNNHNNDNNNNENNNRQSTLWSR